MRSTRRRLLKALAIVPALHAASKEFWDRKDPAQWTAEEKETLLWDSPWAREGIVRFAGDRKVAPTAGTYANTGRIGTEVPGQGPGGVRSVPIGEKPPPVPTAGTAKPVEFRVLARWESAQPIRFSGGPELPAETAQFYVIRLRGLPLMPPPKTKPGEPVSNPNEGLLAAINGSARLERKDKPAIPCAHLLTGSGESATEVLLFFARTNPIVSGDKAVTLECQFGPFHLSVKFSLKEMMYKGQLAI